MAGDADDVLVLAAADRCQDCQRRPLASVSVYPKNRLAALLEALAQLLPVESGQDAASTIIGESPEIQLTREQIRNVARFRDVSVLILGETGTGKELAAEAIHNLSRSSDGPFVGINCAAIPEQLFESELFGHEAGAYTGARGARVGLLEGSAGGTVFLDEIAEMPASLQPKLLRALETRRFRRVGSNRDLPLEGRVVSATHRAEVGRNGRGLRPDLYYRLAGFTLCLPPLRDRRGDIDMLAQSFLRTFGVRHRHAPVAFSDRALEVLHTHDWPGNVRELKLVVEHAAIVASDQVISAADVSLALRHQPLHRQSSRPPGSVQSLPPLQSGVPLRDLERTLIEKTFEDCGRNISRTAKHLGLPRTTLRARLRRYGLL